MLADSAVTCKNPPDIGRYFPILGLFFDVNQLGRGFVGCCEAEALREFGMFFGMRLTASQPERDGAFIARIDCVEQDQIIAGRDPRKSGRSRGGTDGVKA
jgi:hypothetical protein